MLFTVFKSIILFFCRTTFNQSLGEVSLWPNVGCAFLIETPQTLCCSFPTDSHQETWWWLTPPLVVPVSMPWSQCWLRGFPTWGHSLSIAAHEYLWGRCSGITLTSCFSGTLLRTALVSIDKFYLYQLQLWRLPASDFFISINCSMFINWHLTTKKKDAFTLCVYVCLLFVFVCCQYRLMKANSFNGWFIGWGKVGLQCE